MSESLSPTQERQQSIAAKNIDADTQGEQCYKSKIPISLCTIDSSLALKMGFVSLFKFGVLDDFLKWVRS